LQRKALSFFSPELFPRQPRAELTNFTFIAAGVEYGPGILNFKKIMNINISQERISYLILAIFSEFVADSTIDRYVKFGGTIKFVSVWHLAANLLTCCENLNLLSTVTP